MLRKVQTPKLHFFRCLAQKYNQSKSDSFGIDQISSQEIGGERLPDQNPNVIEKFRFAIEARDSLENEEQIQITSFGSVRLDSDNQPKYHAQFDYDNVTLKNNFDSVQQNCLFHDTIQTDSESTANVRTNKSKSTSLTIESDGEFKLNDYSQIELTAFREKATKCNALPTSNCFHFTSEWKQWLTKDAQFKAAANRSQFKYRFSADSEKSSNSPIARFDAVSPLKSFNEIQEEIDEMKQNCELDEEQIDDSIEAEIEKLNQDNGKKVETETKMTAFLYAKELKQKLQKSGEISIKRTFESVDGQEMKLDSKGFHVYSNQVLDLRSLNRADQLLYLQSQILINNNDLVAINKPYGLICPGEHKSEGNGVNLQDLLDEFAQIVFAKESKEKKLYQVHRLDRDTTGVLMLAKNYEAAKKLHQLFSDRKILKKYLAIVKSVPNPAKGMIDIPIQEKAIDGKKRMEMAPRIEDQYRTLIRSAVNAKRAVTEYKVLTQKGNACLLEVKPVTGVKHQIRAHLGLGLRTPILGDHKYSELKRIVPQKLPSDMLQRLRVRQSKVRTIPMHLHCTQLIVPGFSSSGNDLYLQAKLPSYFIQNMSVLGLSR